MAGFNSFSSRDLVALVTLAARTLHEGFTGSAAQIVGDAFAVADEFVKQSDGRWAEGARRDRVNGARVPGPEFSAAPELHRRE